MSSEKFLKQLKNPELSKRRKAVESLGKLGPLRALPHLLKVRKEDESEELRDLASEMLLSMGAIIDMAPMGADTWFEQVKDSSPAFETLCDVMGERFVGYALIVGVQISGLTIDQFTPSNTLVEFRLVESNPPRTLRLPDFRRELVGWILSESPEAESAVLPLDLAQAQQVVGVRYILLAPLHRMSLLQVVLETPGRRPKASVVLEHPDESTEEITVAELRERLHHEVQAELDAARDEPFELDFKLVDQAEAAAESGDWEEVLRLIGHWPGPLSMLSRMQMAANLDDEKRGKIGAALGHLARAYRSTGRSAWAEELYRLGLQFAGEGQEGGRLYRALGESMNEERRYGEAIGPLRRALALGAALVDVAPALSLSLARCRRSVAAVVVAERALEEGGDREALLPALSLAYRTLGSPAVDLLHELHPGWTAEEDLTEEETTEVGAGTRPTEPVDADDSTVELDVRETVVDETDGAQTDEEEDAD